MTRRTELFRDCAR